MDDIDSPLPRTPISQIEWDFIACWRVFTVAIILVFVFQMAVLLSHYWHWVAPLRKEIESHPDAPVVVAAPPVRWTFSYHLLVLLTMGTVGLGLAQNVFYDARPTVFTFLGPVLICSLTVVVNRFTKHYSRNLATVQRRQHYLRR